jgi:hypothetical protein
MYSLVGGGEADGSYSRGFLHSSPPSINIALPNRRLNFVILFASFVVADRVLFFFWGGGSLKSKTHLLPLEIEYNKAKNLFVKNNVVYHRKGVNIPRMYIHFLLRNAKEYYMLHNIALSLEI